MKLVTIVQRTMLASKITAILGDAVREMATAIDPRTRNTLRDRVVAIAICGTARLKELAQVLWGKRCAHNVKSTETALSKSFPHPRYDQNAFLRACRWQVLRQIPAACFRV